MIDVSDAKRARRRAAEFADIIRAGYQMDRRRYNRLVQLAEGLSIDTRRICEQIG